MTGYDKILVYRGVLDKSELRDKVLGLGNGG
jgi:hypothetical protein